MRRMCPVFPHLSATFTPPFGFRPNAVSITSSSSTRGCWQLRLAPASPRPRVGTAWLLSQGESSGPSPAGLCFSALSGHSGDSPTRANTRLCGFPWLSVDLCSKHTYELQLTGSPLPPAASLSHSKECELSLSAQYLLFVQHRSTYSFRTANLPQGE